MHRSDANDTRIVSGAGVYCVFFDGLPFNAIEQDARGKDKYIRTVFVNSGNALRLARKLNKLFNTQMFEVYRMEKGERIG
jgi:hypothetical protein